ncbi:hypothetical protein ACTL6U_10330 [Rhodovibrionaceae bacterium A322]
MLENPSTIPDSLREAQMLLTGGPFEHFSGSLVVVAPNRTVLYCNEAGRDLANLLQSQASPELRNAVEGAFVGRPAQFSPFKPGGSGQTGTILDLSVMPWDHGAAVVLLGRDITFDRAQRAALRGELDRTRSKEKLSNALIDQLTRGLDLDLLAGALLPALCRSHDLSGAALLRGTGEETLGLESLAAAGDPLSDDLKTEIIQALTRDCSFSQYSQDSSLLAALDATPGQAPLVLVIWKEGGRTLSISHDLPLMRDCLKRLLAI